MVFIFFFFFSSRRRHTRFSRDWSSDVCSSDLRLRADLHAVADLGLVLHADLAGHHDVVAGLAAPGDAYLAAKQVVPADLVVVADHDEVVDLRPLADPGRLERRAVDRAIGPDLDVVAD